VKNLLSEYYKEWLSRNPNYFKDYQRKNVLIANQYLKENGLNKCSLCGSIYQIGFHHPDGNNKSYKWVARLKQGTLKRLVAELKKTTPVCNVCHHSKLHRSKK
jgi:hypothetical protein